MIFFIHIPKTAGTSLYDGFRALVGPAVLWYAPARDLEHPIPKAPCDILAEPETRDRFKIFGGHYGFADIKPYLRPDDLVLSVVRDPVVRAYSLYNHVTVNDKNHPMRPMVLGLPIIEASMQHSVFLGEINNHQCWFLSGDRRFGIARKVIEENRVKVFPVTQAHLIVDFAAQALGIAKRPVLPWANKSKNPNYLSEMTDEERGFLRGVNIDDQRLYDYVLERTQQPATPRSENVAPGKEDVRARVAAPLGPRIDNSDELGQPARVDGARGIRFAARKLHTRAGRGVDGAIDYDGSQAGHVLFGPYCPLEPGAWRASFRFDPASTVANCEFNIAYGRGTQSIAVLPRGSAVLQDGCVTLDFDLKAPVEDLECRIRAGGPGHGQILELAIEPRDVDGAKDDRGVLAQPPETRPEGERRRTTGRKRARPTRG